VASVIGVYLFIVYVPGIIFWFVPHMPSNSFMPPPPDDLQWDFAFKLGRHLILFLLVFTFSLMLYISDRLKNAELARRKTEIAYLQSQVNPHFLFNTLNSIYSLTLVKSDQASDAVVKLSNMMRYVLTDASQMKVSLENEIAYVTNYIDLQKLRFSASLQLDVTIKGDPTGKYVAPLLFIPFIENAFKYGVNPEESSHIKIEIDIATHEVHLLVENKKVHVKHVEQTGTGIENTRQRLQLLYANKHLLTVSENETLFTVSLLIITT
jgi:LytS/YehU family sensor histidine kinase